jgi:hypothetical protein
LIGMNIAWQGLGDVTEAGRYPFRDGTIEVPEIEIARWRKSPDTVFRLMRKKSVCERIEYVLGEIAGP